MEARGYRILVKPTEKPRETESGIITSLEGTEWDQMERTGNQYGTVLSIGHTCWKGTTEDEPWCAVGDEIVYSKHAGRYVWDRITQEEWLVINDEDVLCIYRKAEEKQGSADDFDAALAKMEEELADVGS